MGRFDTQIEAIEKGALIRPMPMLGTLTVVGPERASWVAGIVTADVRDLSAGQGAYALSVSRNGRIQSELWVVYEEERVLLGAPKPLLEGLHEAMDRYLIMEDAELAIADEPFAWWLAHGPAAADVVSAAREIGAIAVRAKLGDIDTAIVVSPERTTHNLAEVLTTVSGAVLVTPNAWERIRIERMLPRYGVDFEVDCYPQEASLESLAVSFNKGCYVGQEAVFMLEKRGHVSKRLVRLVLDEEIDLAVGAEVAMPDGKGVGKITSATIGDGKTWAMGMVRYKQTLSGTELTVAGHPAKVSCLGADA